MDRTAAAAVAQGYLAAFASGRPEQVAAYVTEDFRNVHASALGSGCTGKDEYLRRLPGFLASMPGLRYDAEEPIVDGDRVAAPYVLHAEGTDPSGATVPLTIRGVMLLTLSEGLIAERVDVWDALTYLRQTGQA